MQKILAVCVLLLGACASPDGQTINATPESSPTATFEITSTPNVLVIVETPIPTATPMVYVIQEGDTFSELAEQFHISQDELRAANPDVAPNSMTIGATLLIPNRSNAPADASTPTPVPVPVTQTLCHPTADSGLWCFAQIQNNTAGILENVSAQMTLLGANNNSLASQVAFPLLDFIPANSSMPVYVFFPNMPADANLQVQILSAIPLNSSRYLPATLENTSAHINRSGLVAHLSGEVVLPATSPAATQVWVAAVAYDKLGRVIGVRRWEGGAIPPGGRLGFNFAVSSLGSAIDAVEFFVEAR